ncbi:MAG: glucosidase [Deltaproteobacteria bacterium]|nr:glucosidase [Deltaproteobacteria bacterium]
MRPTHADPRRETREHRRLEEQARGDRNWRHFGPYLSDRQWGTVREDYSPMGTAWDYLPHDHARSRAYRWGEDGIGGICDQHGRLCFSLGLWNERDPILKERYFGLTNEEGNHGEDVKELYYYLDATPTFSYLKMLYKYPQGEYPYAKLVEENRRRPLGEKEYELLDTGLFDHDRYFDVFLEYAKAGPDDLLVEVTAHNRGPEAAPLHLLLQLWFRNTWAWRPGGAKPELDLLRDGVVRAQHPGLGEYLTYFDGAPQLLFTDNETNPVRLFGMEDRGGHWKDAFHEAIVGGRTQALRSERRGTKAAAHLRAEVPAGGLVQFRARLTPDLHYAPFEDHGAIFASRRKEADDFYASLAEGVSDPELRRVQRQSLAGLLWSQQLYHFDVAEWQDGDPLHPPPPPGRKKGRNAEWRHLNNDDVLSMPDKWEYPWFAAWDLAFHMLPMALVDPEQAKHQLVLLTREWYMHPNGQLPAYEWAYSDVNPPVHAWATWRVFQIDRKQRGGDGDLAFLERVFHKLLLNFTWWVNRKDTEGRNIFQGGFLGLDNIGVFDRSKPLPTGGSLSQSDGTSWMAMYSLNLLRIALELALHNRVYEDIATKFFEHFLHIAEAMTNIASEGIGLWDEQDQFYYDVLDTPDHQRITMRLRSMVGLIPLFAVETIEPEMLERLPGFRGRLEWFLNYRPDLANLVSRWNDHGRGERRLLSLLRGSRMKRLLRRMLAETEFLSPYGIRALSRQHLEQPYVFSAQGHRVEVKYLPGESDSRVFGGNSNWRGPIWMPVNYLLIESLQKFHHYYGEDFLVECPTGSGQMCTLQQIAEELSDRLIRLFLPDQNGVRPYARDDGRFATDPHFKDHLLFYEYFHGEHGRGVGASHQTGWTALVAKLIHGRRPGLTPHR